MIFAVLHASLMPFFIKYVLLNILFFCFPQNRWSCSIFTHLWFCGILWLFTNWDGRALTLKPSCEVHNVNIRCLKSAVHSLSELGRHGGTRGLTLLIGNRVQMLNLTLTTFTLSDNLESQLSSEGLPKNFSTTALILILYPHFRPWILKTSDIMETETEKKRSWTERGRAFFKKFFMEGMWSNLRVPVSAMTPKI